MVVYLSKESRSVNEQNGSHCIGVLSGLAGDVSLRFAYAELPDRAWWNSAILGLRRLEDQSQSKVTPGYRDSVSKKIRTREEKMGEK